MIDANVNFHKKHVITFLYCFFFSFMITISDEFFNLLCFNVVCPREGSVCLCYFAPALKSISLDTIMHSVPFHLHLVLNWAACPFYILLCFIFESKYCHQQPLKFLWNRLCDLLSLPSFQSQPLFACPPARAFHISPSPLIPVHIHTTGSCH